MNEIPLSFIYHDYEETINFWMFLTNEIQQDHQERSDVTIL